MGASSKALTVGSGGDESCQKYASDYAQVYVLAMFWPSCVVQTVNSVNSDKEGADKRPARSFDASLDVFQIIGGFKSPLRHRITMAMSAQCRLGTVD